MGLPSISQSSLGLCATDLMRTNAHAIARRRAVDNLLRDGLPYSKKLAGHTSCVNALAFSRNGRWFASAGDDPYVQIWDFNQEELSKPSLMFSGPRSNVFALDFSASGQYVYSGDTNDIVNQYDLSHASSPVGSAHAVANSPSWSNTQHEDSIRAISCHPEHDYLFLSAAEDGRIILHDMRANPQYSRSQRVLQHTTEFTGVQYHPTMTNVFATSDNRGRVCLRDVRMAFGPPSQRRNQGIVHTYVTTVARRDLNYMARPEASSLTFDREGRRLGVTMLHHLPTLYALNDPYPIATFSGRHYPDGSPVPVGKQAETYSNSCTMKHGSFGGLGSDREMYYAQGSDDFRTYLWKIPDEAALLERRKVVKHSDWSTDAPSSEIGYASSLLCPIYVPVELSVPLARLTGHDSIVNTALMHPYRPYILTAGIERYIRLHSPTESSPCTEPLTLTPTEVRRVSMASPSTRQLYLRAMGMVDDTVDEDDDDDRQAIALFDHILREENLGEVFDIHPWGGSDDDEDDSGDQVDSDEDSSDEDDSDEDSSDEDEDSSEEDDDSDSEGESTGEDDHDMIMTDI